MFVRRPLHMAMRSIMFHTIKNGSLEYLTADALSGSIHCFSTRYGGVSEGYLSSLNLGTHRGDLPENVQENYRILGQAVGFLPEETVFTRQLHTNTILRVGKKDCGTGLFREQEIVCDGLITNEPGVALVCFAADCTPVLLFDPENQAVAAAHAGWRGTASGIAARAVEAMVREFGSRPEAIRAAIGPSIGQCCFETDEDVPQAMLEAFGPEAERFIEKRGEKYFVDNKGLNRLWLTRAGLTQIDVSPDCTRCQPDRFWSHRVTGGERGSLAAIIKRKEDTP